MPLYSSDDYDRIAGEIVEHAKKVATTPPLLPRGAIIPVSYTDPYQLEPQGVARVEARMKSQLDTGDHPINWCRISFTTGQFYFTVK